MWYEGKILLEKDVYETLSSTCRSRKSKAQKIRNGGVHNGCIVCCLFFANGFSISRRGLSQVAYPEQGNARARTWDKREVEHPRLLLDL